MSAPIGTAEQTRLRKGIMLVGGSGTRLFPVTKFVNKHLLPVYDKPLIYYPLTTLMLAGITEIILIGNAHDLPVLESALGDGQQWGLRFTYRQQEAPRGIAESILIAEDFLAGDPFALILGDNIFYGQNLTGILADAVRQAESQAVVFTVWVANPEAYGVLGLDRNDRPVSIMEKPENPPSHRAVTGLYLYDSRAVQFAKELQPSARNELEITDLNRAYLEDGSLHAIHLGRGLAWFDAGTTRDLLLASELVEIMQSHQRTGIAFPEEVAYRMKLIDAEALSRLVSAMPDSLYREYLQNLVGEIQSSVR